MIEFEYDEAKSQSNKQKHGIDFVEAQALWSDPNLVEIQARTEDEPRALIIGLIDAKHWSAIITDRDGKVRMISVRRSRKIEVEIYES
ncbi:MAG: BrnT family toxin [Pseudomonadales bacterium]